MTPSHIVSKMLVSDTKYPTNVDLLKKIILTSYLGRLRINNLAPDNKIALGNYLFDDERIIFDFTRLSDKKRGLFMAWFCSSHQAQKSEIAFSRVSVNEDRGFTAEVHLSLWGRVKKWFRGIKGEYWKINDFDLSLHYQLAGIEMTHGHNGTLIGFHQYFTPPSGSKYNDPETNLNQVIGNTKRVYITDQLVDRLKDTDLGAINFESLCKNPHPLSADVSNQKQRFEEMHDYRQMQQFNGTNNWFMRIWIWFTSFFAAKPKAKVPDADKPTKTINLLYEEDGVCIYQRMQAGKPLDIIVTEKKPDIDSLVFCGGGAKIFAHVGVWQALNESNILPTRFSGSSAGAIMALLCYLGYTSLEIDQFFKQFKHEHLVHYDFDSTGLSDPASLKTALDYLIACKVTQLVSRYPGLTYPQGKITFLVLDELRKQCPDCELGKQLVVTGTKIHSRETSYFSLTHTPGMEVSEAVKISASFPVLYKPTLLDGVKYNDGGILNNLPTEPVKDSDNQNTVLESEYGNNLGVLVAQFDNGTERNTLDKVMDKVHRENFFLNWIYTQLTGVSDPVSGWVKDRKKLRDHAGQSVIIPVGTKSSFSFHMSEADRQSIARNGYEATKSYLQVRGGDCGRVNDEMMYSTFSSLTEFLAFCCYRGIKKWFEIVSQLITRLETPGGAESNQIKSWRNLYFPIRAEDDSPKPESRKPITFFGTAISTPAPDSSGVTTQNHEVLLLLYPIFLKLSADLLKDNNDKRLFEHARHSFGLQHPYHFIEHADQFKGTIHIMLHVLIQLMKALKKEHSAEATANIQELSKLILAYPIQLDDESMFGVWDLSIPQCLETIKRAQDVGAARQYINSLRKRVEPAPKVEVVDIEPDDEYEDIDSEESGLVLN